MIDTCQDILELEAKSGRDALDEKGAKIFHVYRFLCEYENGGLSGFLYNISPAWKDLTDLSTIAADLKRPEIAEAIGKVEVIMRRGPEDHQGTWGDWLDLADPKSELTELDQTISDYYEPLWEDLESIAADD